MGIGCRVVASQNKIKKKKKTGFVDTIISKVLRDLHFILNQPLKSADNYYSGILKNMIQIHEFVDFSFLVRLILFVTLLDVGFEILTWLL